MRKTILSIFRKIEKSTWSLSIKSFIDSEETKLLSDQPGNYIASDLIAELKIRSNTVNQSKTKAVGIVELLNTLEKTSEDQIFKSYIFKGQGKTAIIYLDEKSVNIFGAILLDRA